MALAHPENELTASALRQDIYRILDRVLETGVPVTIRRKGRILRLVAEKAADRVSDLRRREYLASEPEDLIHLDWSGEWSP